MEWPQHRETEQKLLQIYDQQQQRAHQVAQRGSAGSDTSPKNHQMALKSSDSQTLHAGKVRQMFGERRQVGVKGIDKSNPLEPLESKQRKNWKTQKGKNILGKSRNDSTLIDINDNVINSSKFNFHEKVTIETFGPKLTYFEDEIDNFYHDININKLQQFYPSNKLYSRVKKDNSMDQVDKKLKNTTKVLGKKMPKSDPDGFNPNGSNKKISWSKPVGGMQKTKSLNESKTVNRKIKNEVKNEIAGDEDGDKISVDVETELVSKLEESYPRTESATSITSNINFDENSEFTDDNMASRNRFSASESQKAAGSAKVNKVNTVSTKSCKICGRNFAVDRLKLHQDICSKVNTKKRKTFDATIHRVKGTELESYVKPNLKKASINKKGKKPEVASKPETKPNWRRKHEDFIKTIRAAKEMQAHLNAGGKLSDLPPPPPSDTSDYIKCPHCGRKFNQAAADRHIPKCQHMTHNKPKFKS